MKKLLVSVAITGGLLLGLGGTAFAGEYTGAGLKGKANAPISTPAPENASSACVFSGLDAPDDVENNPPGRDDDDLTIHGVQSYGVFVSQKLKDVVPSPGEACRGNLPPEIPEG
jgi:hypothetical protein